MSAKKSRSASPNRVALLVLGMHRSGTSAFSGVLAELGCDQPATRMIPREDNARGYFESQKIHLFHNGLLESAGSSWDSYGKIGAQWLASPRKAEYHAKALSVLEEEFGTSALFVLKDPRICRLLPFWQDVLEDFGCRPLVAHIHRNPLQVAASLAARDGFAQDLSLLIWLRHVLEAEHGSRGLPRFFTSYPRLLANWSGVARALQDQLGLSLPRFTDSGARGVEAFLSADLRHQNDPEEKLVENPLISAWIRDVYVILERWAAAGEKPDDHAELDRIRNDFDTALPAFSGLADNNRELRRDVAGLRTANARIPDLESQLATKETETASLSGELQEVRNEMAALSGQLHETRSALAQRSHEADELRGELEEARARIPDLESGLAAKETEAASLSGELQEVRNDMAALSGQLHEARSALAQRSHEADELRGELEAARARADGTEERMAALSEQFKTSEASVKARFSELASLTAVLVEKEAEIDQQNAVLSGLHSALQERDGLIAQKEAEMAALRRSSSWRLTAPLRGLSRMLGRR